MSDADRLRRDEWAHAERETSPTPTSPSPSAVGEFASGLGNSAFTSLYAQVGQRGGPAIRRPTPPSVLATDATGRALARTISRRADLSRTESAVQSVGGEEHGAQTVRPPFEHRSLHANDRGFAAALRQTLPEAARSHLSDYRRWQVRAVRPDFGELEREIVHHQVSGRPSAAASRESAIAPPSVRSFAGDAAQGSREMAGMLQSQRENERSRVDGFNRWVPVANDLFGALARLEALQDAYGVRDPERMVEHLQDSLFEATTLASRHRHAVTAPTLSNSLTAQANAVDTALQGFLTASNAVRGDALRDRAGRLRTSFQGDRDRLEAINGTIEQWENLGRTIDIARSALSGARGFLQDGGSVAPVEDDGLPPQPLTGGAAGARSGLTSLGSTVQSRAGLPTDAASGARLLSTAWYQNQIDVIKVRLERLEDYAAGHEQVARELDIAGRLAAFKTALRQLENSLREFEAARTQRQTLYLELGQRLDSLGGGSAHRSRREAHHERSATQSQAASSSTGRCIELTGSQTTTSDERSDTREVRTGPARRPQERFAAVMLMTSAVREVLAHVRAAHAIAQSGDVLPQQLVTWMQQLERQRPTGSDRRPTGHAGARAGGLTRGEASTIREMVQQGTNYFAFTRNLESTFAPVDAQAETLIRHLHGGAGEGDPPRRAVQGAY